MNGFIHIYSRGREPKKDQIVIRLDAVEAGAFDAKLNPLHITELQKNIFVKDSYGHLIHQGNLGTLKVRPHDLQIAPTSFIGQFSANLVEFTLSDNVRIVPDYGLHKVLRDSFTVVKFNQFDQAHDCYHEVHVVTKEGALNFKVTETDKPQRIILSDWNDKFKEHGFDVDLQETYVDVDRELFLEDIFHNVTEEALVVTGVGVAFDPTFRVAPLTDEATVVKKPRVDSPMEEADSDSIIPIKNGHLMVLSSGSDPEDDPINDECVSSDSSDDEVCREYDPVTGGIRKYYQDECTLDMSLAPPAYITGPSIITTPDLLKRPETPPRPEYLIKMSELIHPQDTDIKSLASKV